MKTIMLRVSATLISIVTLNSTVTEARTVQCNDLARYAQRIDSISHELRQELVTHYRHTHEFYHLMRSISRIINMAHHITEVSVYSHSSLQHISNDLEGIDREVHHINEIMKASTLSWNGRSHTHGRPGHVHRLRYSLNETIHSMQYVVSSLRHQYKKRSSHRPSHTIQRQISPGITLLSLILSQL